MMILLNYLLYSEPQNLDASMMKEPWLKQAYYHLRNVYTLACYI